MNKLADSPAFPHTVSFTPDSDGLGSTAHVVQQGMTLRQFAAIHAMQGLLTSINFGGGEYEDDYMPRAAKLATLAADALLAELAKTTSQSC